MLNNFSQEYNEKGFVVLSSLISSSEIQKYAEIAKRHDYKSPPNAIVHYLNDYIKFLDLRSYLRYSRFIDLRYFFDCLYLIFKSKNQNWKRNIPTLSFNYKTAVSRIDSYISKKSDEDIVEWHCDQSFGGATHPAEFFGNANGIVSTKNENKLFLHITDVKYGNGAFSYIPYSHKINMAIRNLINKRIIKYKPFLLLKDAIELVGVEHKDKFLQILTEEQIENFIKNAKKALSNDKEFLIECKAGDAVLFNEFGYHKGTAPKLSDRIIFRYFY
jgi:hypothetical protein